jgi:hypothetical protein
MEGKIKIRTNKMKAEGPTILEFMGTDLNKKLYEGHDYDG